MRYRVYGQEICAQRGIRFVDRLVAQKVRAVIGGRNEGKFYPEIAFLAAGITVWHDCVVKRLQ